MPAPSGEHFDLHKLMLEGNPDLRFYMECCPVESRWSAIQMISLWFSAFMRISPLPAQLTTKLKLHT